MYGRAVAAIAFVSLGIAACSSSSPARPDLPKGAVPAGTAQVSVGDHGARTMHDVVCQTNQSLTSIKIGSDSTAVTILVDNADGLTARSVDITGVGGFTGSYWRDVQGSASTRMVGQTYVISGSADGFRTDNPARTPQDFTITAAC